jgi:uncharacterized protein YlxW (UPF0749 family)
MSSNETVDRIISLEKRIAYLQKENEELKNQVGLLKTQLTSINGSQASQQNVGNDFFFKDTKNYQ